MIVKKFKCPKCKVFFEKSAELEFVICTVCGHKFFTPKTAFDKDVKVRGGYVWKDKILKADILLKLVWIVLSSGFLVIILRNL